ncbi:MAG: helix-turn-helix domain-containing protein [Roseiarcus sp.]|jgi:hypothetical protein
MNRDDELVTTADAAKITTLAISTLEGMRVRGEGPPFLKIGRRVAYSRGDLLAFALRDRRKSTSDPGAVHSGEGA